MTHDVIESHRAISLVAEHKRDLETWEFGITATAANFSHRGGVPRTRDFLAALSPASYVDRLALFIRVRRGGAHPHYELSARRGAFRAHSTAAIEKSYSRRD